MVQLESIRDYGVFDQLFYSRWLKLGTAPWWGFPWYSNHVIIPHVKIVSRDWLTKVGHSIMSTSEMSTGKTSTVLTGSTGSHCCFRWYFTKLWFVRYNKTNIPCQCGYPDGMSPLGWFSRGRSPKENHPPSGRHSIRMPTLAWHISIMSHTWTTWCLSHLKHIKSSRNTIHLRT